MHKAIDIKLIEDFRGIFVGRKGSGKSKAASSFPKPMKVYDLDRRIRSLAGIEGIEYIQFGRSSFKEVDTEMERDIDLIRQNKYPYKTTLFSSLTSCQKLLMQDAKRLIGEIKDSKSNKQKEIKIGTLIMAEWQHWNFVSQAIDQIFLNGLFYFPGNLIIEAHQVTKFNPDGVPNGKTLLGTEKIAESVPTFFDEVWEFSKVEGPIVSGPVKYVVQFKSTLADTTYQKFPKDEVSITDKDFYNEIFMKLLGEKYNYAKS